MSKTSVFYKDIAPGAAENAEFLPSGESEFSDTGLLRRETAARAMATGEWNEWILDGSVSPFTGEDIPFWSTELSGEDCLFEHPPSLDIRFTKQFASLGITLVFNDATFTWASRVGIRWYQGEQLRADREYEPTGQSFFCQEKVEAFDRIVITFLRTSLPCKYLKLQQVIFGIYRTFGMGEIRSARVTNQMNRASLELPVSTLSWTIDSDDELGFMFQFKQPMEVRNDGFLIGVYYITDSKRRHRRVYDLTCQDALGVLDGDTFAGGYYSRVSAMALLREILGGDFDVDFTDVEDTALTGIIKPMTKRAAIQQVAFAWGVCVATDGGEVIRVFNLDTTPEAVGRDRTYTGVTVTTAAMVTAVRVTAHSYTPAENGSVEVGGVKYADATQVFEVRNPDVTANTRQNVKEVKEATLVSPDIGAAAARRVYGYYSLRDTAKARIVWRGELLGDCVTLPSSWDAEPTGNIERMDYVLSNTVAAEVEVLA